MSQSLVTMAKSMTNMKMNLNLIEVTEKIENDSIDVRMKRIDDVMNWIIWGDKKEFYDKDIKEDNKF